MATTSIWPINGNISKVIHYVSNPDKTENSPFNNSDIQSLKDVMDYAVNPSKTEQQFLIKGINCDPSIARQQMIITKNRFGYLISDIHFDTNNQQKGTIYQGLPTYRQTIVL